MLCFRYLWLCRSCDPGLSVGGWKKLAINFQQISNLTKKEGVLQSFDTWKLIFTPFLFWLYSKKLIIDQGQTKDDRKQIKKIIISRNEN